MTEEARLEVLKLRDRSGRVTQVVCGVLLLALVAELSTGRVLVAEKGDVPGVAAGFRVDCGSSHGDISDIRQGLQLLLHGGTVTTAVTGSREGVMSDRCAGQALLDVDH